MHETNIARRAVQKVKRLAELRREFERQVDTWCNYLAEDMICNPEVYDAAMTAGFSHHPILMDCWQVIRQRLAAGQPPFPDDALPAPPGYWKSFNDAWLKFGETRTPPEMNQAVTEAGNAFLNAGGSPTFYEDE